MQTSIDHKGKRVAYKVAGEGAPLVLLHGFGFDSRIWETLTPLLKGRLKIIMPDLPGSGESETPDGEPSLEYMADAVAAVIQKECHQPCNVIGHSMGGYVTLALVERHAGLVNAFGLFHSHPFADDDSKKAKRDKDADFVKRHGSAAYINVLIPGLFASAFKEKHPEIVNALVSRYAALAPDSLVYALKAMKARPDRSAVVSSVTKAFLFIAGVEDPVVNMETVARVYKMPQYTFGLFIREAAHMGMIETPDACFKHVMAWTGILATETNI